MSGSLFSMDAKPNRRSVSDVTLTASACERADAVSVTSDTLTASACERAEELRTLEGERDVLLLMVKHQESTIAWLQKSLCNREVELATLRKIQRLQSAISTIKDQGEEEQSLRRAANVYALKLYSSLPQSREVDGCLRQLERERQEAPPPPPPAAKDEKAKKRSVRMLEQVDKMATKKRKLDVLELELMSVTKQLLDVREMWLQLQHLKSVASGPERQWAKLQEVDRKLGDVRRKLGRVENGLSDPSPPEC